MILKLGMQHRELKLYKVCINGDPGLTLTIKGQCQIWWLVRFEWEKLSQSN